MSFSSFESLSLADFVKLGVKFEFEMNLYVERGHALTFIKICLCRIYAIVLQIIQ